MNIHNFNQASQKTWYLSCINYTRDAEEKGGEASAPLAIFFAWQGERWFLISNNKELFYKLTLT